MRSIDLGAEMARKKGTKLDFEKMGELKQNPFAALSGKFLERDSDRVPETPRSDEPSSDLKEKSAQQAQRVKLLIRLEKRPGGRVATRIYHFEGDAEAFVSELRKKLATGGTVDEGIIELRGDLRERLPPLLDAKGFTYRLG